MQPRAPVAGEREDRGHRFHIWLGMVSNDRLGCHLCAHQGLTKKASHLPDLACHARFRFKYRIELIVMQYEHTSQEFY